jgi:hypothetical protein
MSKWMRRASVSLAAAAGLVALNLAAGWAAAPLSSATADANGAQGVGAGVPGTLTVSQSDATVGADGPHASWSAVNVAGTNVIGRSDGEWSGSGAGAGSLVDSLNGATCGAPIEGIGGACVALLPSYTDTGDSLFGQNASANGALAVIGVAAVQGDNIYGGSVEVLPSGAEAAGAGCGVHSSSTASLLDVNTYAGAPESAKETVVGGASADHPGTCS